MVSSPNPEKGKEFTSFVVKRMILASALIVALVWGLSAGLNLLDSPQRTTGDAPISTAESHPPAAAVQPIAAPQAQPPADPTGHAVRVAPAVSEKMAPAEAAPAGKDQPTALVEQKVSAPSSDEAHSQNGAPQQPAASGQGKPAVAEQPAPVSTARPETPSAPAPAVHEPLPVGVAFVQATIKPLEYELKHRFWGWRPNDIIDLTDNVNSYQLGVLEVTRRTVVQLAERISRTGSTASFNRNLENAMNWLMIRPESYWFPAPEAKYIESLEELETYRQKLLQKSTPFYTRTDNLIPLLSAFEDLLGSCDENLVKLKEADGSSVSYFHTDDYFYYARGVASAMGTILEAVEHDFSPMLQGRLSAELLHHAIESCKRAADINPWLVTDGNLGGILANHRAHMAAPISHARFYLGQLIKTLST